MTVYNFVAEEFHERPAEVTEFVASLGSADGDGSGLMAWVDGYAEGISLRGPEWDEFAEQSPEFVKMCSPLGMVLDIKRDPEKKDWLRDAAFRANLARAVGMAVVAIRDLWRERLVAATAMPARPARRDAPKAPPNAPCPCGSGQKYKRCCGSPLRAVP